MDKSMSDEERERGESLSISHLEIWTKQARKWTIAMRGRDFTADDLIAAVGLPTYEDGAVSNNGVGGFISKMAQQGLIVGVGYKKSERVSNHSRVLRIWRVR